MTRFRWWLAGLVMLALPASVAVGQSTALATVALACPLGHEAAQTPPASDESAAICPVQRLLREFLEKWALLWQYGQYQQAERLAVRAVQLCPTDVDAQHALTVTRIVSANGIATRQSCPTPDSGKALNVLRVIPYTGHAVVSGASAFPPASGADVYEAGCLPYGQFECEELCQTSAKAPVCCEEREAARHCKACVARSTCSADTCACAKSSCPCAAAKKCACVTTYACAKAAACACCAAQAKCCCAATCACARPTCACTACGCAKSA